MADGKVQRVDIIQAKKKSGHRPFPPSKNSFGRSKEVVTAMKNSLNEIDRELAMMNSRKRTWNGLVRVLIVCGSLIFGGCDGTETRRTMDDTVEEMAGKKKVTRYKQIQEEIGEIQRGQTEKYRQLESDGQ